MENKDQPAFPVLELKEINDKFLLDCGAAGVSKREFLAAKAMQGLLSNWEVQCKICDVDPRYNGNNFAEVIAINSIEFADALLAELEKPKP
jgi:hypothetical protein